MIEFEVNTGTRNELVDLTSHISGLALENKWTDGILTVFIPHTTAAVTINENADPDVKRDIIITLNQKFPENGNYRHVEGNADAHIKASLVGNSLTVIVENGKLKLGTWQGIFFCEFDGPRTRKVWLKFIKG